MRMCEVLLMDQQDQQERFNQFLKCTERYDVNMDTGIVTFTYKKDGTESKKIDLNTQWLGIYNSKLGAWIWMDECKPVNLPPKDNLSAVSRLRTYNDARYSIYIICI